MVGGSDEGKIYCWEGRSIGIKNILLTQIKISEIGICSLCWHSYPNDPSSLKLLCFTGELAIIFLKLQVIFNNRTYEERLTALTEAFQIKMQDTLLRLK